MLNTTPNQIMHDQTQVTCVEELILKARYLEMRKIDSRTNVQGREFIFLGTTPSGECFQIRITNSSGGSHTERRNFRSFGILPYHDGTWEAENYLVPAEK